MSEESKGKSRRNLVIGGALAVILFVLFVPMIACSEAYDETEPYQREESYTEMEPYEREEAYTEMEPYEREATYVVDDWDLRQKLGFLDVYVQSDVELRNTDKYGGTFKVVHKLYDIDGLFGTVEDSFYLDAGESYTSTATFDTKWGQDTKGSYSVVAPTIIDQRLVTKTRTVTDQRLVTKTRTVTDYRLVTKYRTVYKSIIQLLLY